MPRLFGENTPSFNQGSLIVVFKIFDLLNPEDNPAQFDQLKRVSKDWRDTIEEYRDRFILYTAILKECHLFSSMKPHSLQSVIRLAGGMTNITFFFEAIDKKYIGRVPGKSTGAFISRQDECHNIRIANALGISAPLIFDKLTGIQVTQFLPEPEAMSRELLRAKENISLCMQPLKRLHSSGAKFKSETNVFQRNRSMLNILNNIRPDISATLKSLSETMDDIEQLISLLPINKVPCHNDTTPSNFIKSNNEVKLIDWEYANNNDRMWDLACLSMEAGFTEQQDRDMLEAYFGIYPINNYYHLILYKPVVEYWTMLWAEVQIANNNYADEKGLTALKEMAATRKQSCLEWLENAEFKTACETFETNNEPISYCNRR